MRVDALRAIVGAVARGLVSPRAFGNPDPDVKTDKEVSRCRLPIAKVSFALLH